MMTRIATTLFSVIIFIGLMISPLVHSEEQNPGPPASDIWLFKIDSLAPLVVSLVRRITQRQGYDNQPAFRWDNEGVYFTRHQDQQTDIYYYSLSQDTVTAVTQTFDSEYSPTPYQKDFLSSVSVNDKGQQFLVSIPVIPSDKPFHNILAIEPVGYHVWLNPDILALFVLGEPNTLQLAQVSTHASYVIDRGIGRSLHKVPNQLALSYINTQGFITHYDLNRGKRQLITKALADSQDFTWLGDDTLLMARDSQLYAYRINETSLLKKSWIPVPSMAQAALSGMTRLAVSPNLRYLAVVANYQP